MRSLYIHPRVFVAAHRLSMGCRSVIGCPEASESSIWHVWAVTPPVRSSRQGKLSDPLAGKLGSCCLRLGGPASVRFHSSICLKMLHNKVVKVCRGRVPLHVPRHSQHTLMCFFGRTRGAHCDADAHRRVQAGCLVLSSLLLWLKVGDGDGEGGVIAGRHLGQSGRHRLYPYLRLGRDRQLSIL